VWVKNLRPSAPRLAVVLVLAGISALFAGCHGPGSSTFAVNPSIEFTSVPLAGADNPEKLNTIEGKVKGARVGQQIVLYARGQTTWWVQPFANEPFTKLHPDSTWRSSTHPGTEYAALLVGPDFHPPSTADTLPTQGVFAAAVTKGEIAFWRRWWFPFACVITGAFAIFGFHQLRLRQMSKQLNLRFEERLAERTRVAQELHDTLLQGVLSASMQLHVAVDRLPEDAPVRPALNRVLELMAQVVDEGRNTLRGLRSSIDSKHDLKASFSRVPQELGRQDGVGFRVVVEGPSLPLRPSVRDEVYSVGREALVNAFRHSEAANIEVELEYAPDQLRVLVRDDGCGIDPQVLQSGRDGHWGLSGMRERAERIGAKLKVLSRAGGGTEVELRVPRRIAFESDSSDSATKWLSGLHRRHAGKTQPAARERV